MSKLSLAFLGVCLLSGSLAHAGDIQLSQQGKNLKLKIGPDGVQVSLTSVPSGGGDPVQGKLSVTPGLGTTVNGSMEAVKLAGVESISVQGGAAQSEVDFGGVSIAKKLSFQGKDGPTLIGFEDNIIGGDVSLHAGHGNLGVEGGGNQIAGKLDIKGGPSPDDVSVAANVLRGVSIALGNGSNETSFEGAVGRPVMIKGGTFLDSVSIGDLVCPSLKLDLGSGANSFELGSSVIQGKLNYLGKDGNDAVLVAGTIIQGDALVNLGNGGNEASFDDTTFDADLSVKGGSGDDIVTFLGSTSVGGKTSFKLGGGSNSQP
jgi:hypothetical protein